MAFNWGSFLTSLAALAPVIVAGVEQIHVDASTETKAQLALDSLNLATGVSEAILSADPQDQAYAQDASAIAGSVITVLQRPPTVPVPTLTTAVTPATKA